MIYKPGDEVIIIKPKAIPEGDILWEPEMDEYINKKMTIKKINRNHYIFKEMKEYGWREEWVEDPFLTLINMVTK